ncbi:uncharacterized protein LOC129885095 [Solanum dulcamara]|uniref:uncharacterized protein LOC129885095 n=1 Tax=Solanum dulcamara TaxID=45834 RepID=UPI002486AA4D|nr:uncharacterized protein LOC129885095 [Solanum dulcamara]
MTMINPCENISRENLIRRSSVYGFGLGDYESNFNLMSRLGTEEDDEYYGQRDNSYVLGSDLALIELMAEDESRTGSVNETGSSSKDNNNNKKEKEEDEEEEEEKGWLQLSIGMPTNNKPEGNSSRLVELDLLPTVSSEQGKSTLHIHEFRAPPPRRQQQQFLTTSPTSSSSLFLQQYPRAAQGNSSTTMFPQQQEIINWGFRPMTAPIQQNMNLSLVSSGSHFGPGPFPVLGGVPGPSSIDLRVVHPPRRPHSGLWFSLQTSSNQTKEPFLPQISKNYIRIKDGRMTIRLVLKYLVNKLQLENESEIEITCRGQQLQPFLTLQHVRDHIWSSTTNAADNILTLLPSETSNHVMVLHYARTSAPQN